MNGISTQDVTEIPCAQRTALDAEIGRLTTRVAWLKTNLACHRDRAARLALVEREQSELPLTVQADLLSISRSSLYYRPCAPSLEEVAIKHRIDALYTQYPFSGSRRITAQMRRDGMDGKGRAQDNNFVERLWRTVRDEEVYLRDYATPREACRGLGAYFMFYNEERPHQELGYQTPAETYFATAAH
jgi:transposase InsO family protein